MTLPLRISQRTVKRSRNINMEQRPVQPLNNRYPAPMPSILRIGMSIRLTVLQLLGDTTRLGAVARVGMRSLNVATSYLR